MFNNCKQRIEAGLIESEGELLQKSFQEAADISLDIKQVKDNLPRKSRLKCKKKMV